MRNFSSMCTTSLSSGMGHYQPGECSDGSTYTHIHTHVHASGQLMNGLAHMQPGQLSERVSRHIHQWLAKMG